MYGGDWPFALLGAHSYQQVWDGINGTLGALGRADRHAVLAGTARRVYALEDLGRG
jgi:predicted TIM-barrel fold metal-dependent hydrolase